MAALLGRGQHKCLSKGQFLRVLVSQELQDRRSHISPSSIPSLQEQGLVVRKRTPKQIPSCRSPARFWGLRRFPTHIFVQGGLIGFAAL